VFLKARMASPTASPMPRTAVFLDRDGVLNEVPGSGDRAVSPTAGSELVIVPNAASEVARLRMSGFVLLVVTNQPDVARGRLTREAALSMTQSVVDDLDLDGAYVCLHDGPDRCPCRKPRGGALQRGADDWGLHLASSWMIGDRWVDVAAGRDAGVRTVLLGRPYSWDRAGGEMPPLDLVPDLTASSLGDAIDQLLEHADRRR
jgi:D-glycero-D-manno-heptose 1,7-bisphosphate phosphatase